VEGTQSGPPTLVLGGRLPPMRVAQQSVQLSTSATWPQSDEQPYTLVPPELEDSSAGRRRCRARTQPVMALARARARAHTPPDCTGLAPVSVDITASRATAWTQSFPVSPSGAGSLTLAGTSGQVWIAGTKARGIVRARAWLGVARSTARGSTPDPASPAGARADAFTEAGASRVARPNAEATAKAKRGR